MHGPGVRPSCAVCRSSPLHGGIQGSQPDGRRRLRSQDACEVWPCAGQRSRKQDDFAIEPDAPKRVHRAPTSRRLRRMAAAQYSAFGQLQAACTAALSTAALRSSCGLRRSAAHLPLLHSRATRRSGGSRAAWVEKKPNKLKEACAPALLTRAHLQHRRRRAQANPVVAHSCSACMQT